MGSINTMMLMSESFINLTEQNPIDKISISDIVAASGKNRKTFYYHFESKAHLIRWIFRNDLAETLRDRFDESHLVYEDAHDDAITGLPYYIFKKSGVRSLDGSEFFCALADTFQKRRSYYAKALRANDQESLRAYLFSLYTPALENDIKFILSNRSLDDASVRFLAEFFTGAFVTYIANKITTPGSEHPMRDVSPFENIIHSSLENEIKEQQLKRVL